MTGIVVTPHGGIISREFDEPLHRSTGKVVDGNIEIVRPHKLPRPYIMIVNEDFLNLGLPLNQIGSFLYGIDRYGHPICGNFIIMKEIGEDIIGLDKKEQQAIKELMITIQKAIMIA